MPPGEFASAWSPCAESAIQGRGVLGRGSSKARIGWASSGLPGETAPTASVRAVAAAILDPPARPSPGCRARFRGCTACIRRNRPFQQRRQLSASRRGGKTIRRRRSWNCMTYNCVPSPWRGQWCPRPASSGTPHRLRAFARRRGGDQANARVDRWAWSGQCHLVAQPQAAQQALGTLRSRRRRRDAVWLGSSSKSTSRGSMRFPTADTRRTATRRHAGVRLKRPRPDSTRRRSATATTRPWRVELPRGHRWSAPRRREPGRGGGR